MLIQIGLVVLETYPCLESHGINAFMVGISFTGVGAIVAGVYFVADFATSGVNLLVNGEAKGLGDLTDEYFGTVKLYDGIY